MAIITVMAQTTSKLLVATNFSFLISGWQNGIIKGWPKQHLQTWEVHYHQYTNKNNIDKKLYRQFGTANYWVTLIFTLT